MTPDSSKHMTCVRLESSRREEKKEYHDWPVGVINESIRWGTICYRIISKFQGDFILQCSAYSSVERSRTI